jgi:hypothetical protein
LAIPLLGTGTGRSESISNLPCEKISGRTFIVGVRGSDRLDEHARDPKKATGQQLVMFACFCLSHGQLLGEARNLGGPRILESIIYMYSMFIHMDGFIRVQCHHHSSSFIIIHHPLLNILYTLCGPFLDVHFTMPMAKWR